MAEVKGGPGREVPTNRAPKPSGDVEQPTSRDRFAAIVAVISLGISWPILETIGGSPPFFLARDATRLDVVATAVCLGLVLPMLAGSVALLPGRWGRLGGFVLMGLGAAGVVGTFLRSVGSASTAVWILAVALAVPFLSRSLGAWLSVRRMLRLLAWSPTVVTLAFLVFTPSGRLAWASGDPPPPQPVVVETEGPAIVLILDELSTTTLMAADGTIRSKWFPNFAALAEDGTWFRRATAVHTSTDQAVPAMLTGSFPTQETYPTAEQHPHNLLRRLSTQRQVRSYEAVTKLCDDRRCAGFVPRPPGSARLALLVSDLAVLTARQVLPPALGQQASRVEANWANFGVLAINEAIVTPADITTRLVDLVTSTASESTVYFTHVLLPHQPWVYLPDGSQYELAGDSETGLGGYAGRAASEVALQRHILQTMFVDSVIGDLMEAIDNLGYYESTTVLVVADHGVAFSERGAIRLVDSSTVAEVGFVPFILKSPGVEAGLVDDYPATVIDVTPTLLEVLGDDPPMAIDGISLVGAERPERPRSEMVVAGIGREEWSSSATDMLVPVQRIDRLFPDGNPFHLVPSGATPVPWGADIDRIADRWSPTTDWTIEPHQPVSGGDRVLVTAEAREELADRLFVLAIDDTVAGIGRSWERDGKAVLELAVEPELLHESAELRIFAER